MRNTYKKSWLSAAALLLSLTLLLAACGGKTETKKEEANPEEAYQIKHAMGEAKIPKKPERVVVLTNEGTEAVLAMGVKPVGAVQSWLGDPWYDHIKKDMKDVKTVGTESEVNLEAIAALKPDLIIGNKMRQEAVYEKLNAIAPTVFSETLRGDWKENFSLYSKALDREEEGKKVIGDFDKRIDSIKEQAGDKLSQKVSVVRFMAGKTRVYYDDSFSGVIFKQLGIKHPEGTDKLFAADQKDQFMREVGKEAIPQMDGDMIFYFTYAPPGDTEAVKTEEEFTKDPLWQNLNAVKNNKVYKVDDAIWNTAGGVMAANKMLDEVEKYIVQK
ncbi:iron-siderophore ABC transporter substrate-binding protein [Bacillus sp. FJAT-42376]|uniref:ABC transporter substrate-binding protein n=1 Tax=Bacillus sp. FJAT-42376 TaxID=2014076 RepID=UPI000F50951E|nr:iron-siderophore ABC transporter substrate-binding protein [Bacillus sp. FJAT-42376]AZB44331.1 iron-siderophore ABC transporter substrate-binding protein [Bacillus sp. FJAT-42376]